MNMNHLCPGCMRKKPSYNGACPYCGFDAAADDKIRPTHILPPCSVIGGRYLTGRCLAQYKDRIIYLAFDLQSGHKVQLCEFFPRAYVWRDVRQAETLCLIPGHEAAFADRLERFLHQPCEFAFRDRQTGYLVRALQDDRPAASAQSAASTQSTASAQSTASTQSTAFKQAPIQEKSSASVKQQKRKMKKKRSRFLLPPTIILAVVLMICVVILVKKRESADEIYVEADSSVLYADQTMFTAGETAPVCFTVRTTNTEVDSFDLYNGDTWAATLAPVRTEGDVRYFEGTLEMTAQVPTLFNFTARSGQEESSVLTLRFAPEITDEMMQTAYDVLDELNDMEEEAFPDGDPDEAFVETVYAHLLDDSRVKKAVLEETCVQFITIDGLGCMYHLPLEEGTFGSRESASAESDSDTTFDTMQKTGELVTAIQSAGGIEEADFSDIYVRNDYSPTSTDVLFLQSFEGITSVIVADEVQQYVDFIDFSKNDYHEDFCKKIADFVGGDFELKRDVDFLSSLFDGSWCDYGTIVVNTHGLKEPLYHMSDGSIGTSILIVESRDLDKYKDWYETRQYLYADYFENVEENKYDENFRNAPLFLESDGSLWASTDLIMDQYSDKFFDNTVFVFDVCFLLRDEAFCRFLFSHGAQVLVGSPNSIKATAAPSWIKHLGDVWTDRDAHGKCSSYLSEGLDNDDHLFTDDVLEVRLRRMENGHSTYTYRGRGELYGTVVSDGVPVRGAKVTAYWYYNHRLHPVIDDPVTPQKITVMKTKKDGVFHIPDDQMNKSRRWGTYVIRVDYQGETVYAQLNFHGADGCGTIDISSALPSDSTEEETTEQEETTPAPELDYQGMLETYLQEVLVPEYGVMSIKRHSYDRSSLQNSGAFQGILSAEITDLDRDGAEELLVYRFEDGKETDSLVYLEIYEAAESGVYLADDLHFKESCFRSEYLDVRSALFLCDAGIYTGITLYINIYMNSSHEVIRQYRYDGSTLTRVLCDGTATGGGPRGTVWYRKSEDDQISGNAQDCSSLSHGGFGISDGFEQIAYVNEEDYSNGGFADADQQLLTQYTDALRFYGMERNGKRIMWDELYDATSTEKYSVQDLFSNSDSINWIGELDTCDEYMNNTTQQVVIPIDYAGLVH